MHKLLNQLGDMQEELADAPRDVQSAMKAITGAVQRGQRPTADLVLFVTQWVGKRGSQSRFGK